jgi:hypothetical protein
MMLPGAYIFDVWYFGLWYLFSSGVLRTWDCRYNSHRLKCQNTPSTHSRTT